jgi:hypothetical protein
MGRRPDPARPRPSEVAGGTVTPVVGGVLAGRPQPGKLQYKAVGLEWPYLGIAT